MVFSHSDRKVTETRSHNASDGSCRADPPLAWWKTVNFTYDPGWRHIPVAVCVYPCPPPLLELLCYNPEAGLALWGHLHMVRVCLYWQFVTYASSDPSLPPRTFNAPPPSISFLLTVASFPIKWYIPLWGNNFLISEVQSLGGASQFL